MKKINLLPRDLASKGLGLSEEFILYIRKVAIGLGGLVLVLILLGVGLRIEFTRRSNILEEIMTKIKESDLLTENIEDLRRRVVDLRQELADINDYLSGGLVWSEKLTQISLLMPNEVWLNRMSFQGQDIARDTKEYLNLSGALVPLEDRPPISVLSAFVSKAKEDKEFFADFQDLLVSEVSTAKKDKVDIMKFEIKLAIKQ